MKDHYAVLHLRRSATPADIKKAFRRLALLYHPDRNDDPKASALFMEIVESYQVLTNPESKDEYDASLAEDGEARDFPVSESDWVSSAWRDD